VRIPHASLSPAALRGLVEEFVTRDGTDYGEVEASLDDKATSVLTQLRAGRIVVLYDVESETCTLATAEDAARAGF